MIDIQAVASAAQSALVPFLELGEEDGHSVPTKVDVIEAGIDGISVVVSDLPHTIDDVADVELAIMRQIEQRTGLKKVNIALSRSSSDEGAVAKNAGPMILAVGSGKGGVGKSTLSTGLALALKDLGLRVGLLDADIYGPSVPKMLGAEGDKTQFADSMLQPVLVDELPTLSIGYMIEPEQAVMWRGPMLVRALKKMLLEADWGDIEILIVDLPPGTGDVQLTLAQNAKLAGAVVVSTPQDMALADARKAISLFNRINVPILGVVENMSGFECPHCGEKSYVFGQGGAENEAIKHSVPFLGSIPLDPALMTAADSGKMNSDCVSGYSGAAAFTTVARNLLSEIFIRKEKHPQ
jgi:Mrp family chromosome partitioning ATPase